MPRKLRTNPMLNNERLSIIRKGYANISDLQKFIPASYMNAKKEYEAISNEIAATEGKIVPWYGIEISRVLKRLGITEKDVRRWADDELSIHTNIKE